MNWMVETVVNLQQASRKSVFTSMVVLTGSGNQWQHPWWTEQEKLLKIDVTRKNRVFKDVEGKK